MLNDEQRLDLLRVSILKKGQMEKHKVLVHRFCNVSSICHKMCLCVKSYILCPVTYHSDLSAELACPRKYIVSAQRAYSGFNSANTRSIRLLIGGKDEAHHLKSPEVSLCQ